MQLLLKGFQTSSKFLEPRPALTRCNGFRCAINAMLSLVSGASPYCCCGPENHLYCRTIDAWSSFSSTFVLKVSHFNIIFVYGGYIISVPLLISYFYLNIRPPLCKLRSGIILFP